MSTEKRRRRDEEEDDDDRPSRGRRPDKGPKRRRGKSSKQSKINPLLIWVPLIALLAVGMGLGIYLVTRSNKPTERSTASGRNDETTNDTSKLIRPPIKKSNTGSSATETVKKLAGKDSNIVKARSVQCLTECFLKDTPQVVVNETGGAVGVAYTTNENGKLGGRFDRFDVKSEKRLNRFDVGNANAIRQMAFSPDGNTLLYIATDESDNLKAKLFVTDLDKDAPIKERFDLHPEIAAPGGLVWAEFVGNDKIVTVSSLGAVNQWTLPDFKPAASLNITWRVPWFSMAGGHVSFLKDVALSPDRRLLAISNNNDFSIIDLENNKLLGRVQDVAEFKNQPTRQVLGVSFSSNSEQVIALIFTGTLEKKEFRQQFWFVTWDVNTRQRDQIEVVDEQIGIQGDRTLYTQIGGGITLWGPDHILYHDASGATLMELKSRKPVCRLILTSLGKIAYTRDGSLWYTGADDFNSVAYVNRLDLLKWKSTDPDVWTNGYLRRFWLVAEGASTRSLLTFDGKEGLIKKGGK